MLVKKEWTLEGLDCANCAAKIEREVSNIKDVKEASVDFITKKLVIQSEENIDLNHMISIIKKIEPDVEVIEIDEKKEKGTIVEDNSFKTDIIKLIVSGILFAIGTFLKLPEAIELSVFIISYVIIGGDIVYKAIKNILKGKVFDENFLMSIATIGAFGIGSFSEGVAVMLFYKVGELFQDIAVHRSRKSISELMNIRPDYANIKHGENIMKISPDEIKVGDIIIVKPGEKVPLDGKVLEGSSFLDTSALTGESIPKEVLPGSEVLSGFINTNGILVIEVTKLFKESTVSKILDLVQNASSKKASAENFITKFARYYTPIVVIAALIIAVVPSLVLRGQEISDWIYRSLVFLVISCPCALVVSIPLGFFGGIGGASRKGILIKGSNYLEALNNVETVVFDKTGTLTKGTFNVVEINVQDNCNKEQLIEFAAYAESYSNHPIASSIIKKYKNNIDMSKIEKYDEIPGHGIRAIVNGKEILAGNIKLMIENNIEYINSSAMGTIVHIAVDKVYMGNIVIADEVKKDSLQAIKELKLIGVKQTVMLTGDSKTIGKKIGEELGIDLVYAELLPNEKVERLELLEKQKTSNGKVIFVGDGINDAPVLARADIGIAMGGLGSDAAIEAADVVIMTDEPSKIVTAIKVAKKTKRIVWQNIYFALGIKIMFLFFGAIGLSTMWEAVFADVGVSLIAVVNAMRTMKVDKI